MNMSDQLKFIVGELNSEPFKCNYNLITFDSLEPLSFLQVLTDVLAELDPKQKVDVREEAADQTAIRIFTVLRILKYRPPADASGLEAFRKGIVQGDKHVICPILEWLLRRMPELKERAYLARFLVKINIPPDFLGDSQLSDLYEQYEQLIQSFMESHKELTALKNSSFSTADIKKDIASMEDEKDQLIKRVDRLKRKVEAAPNSAPMLAVARNLRVERDRDEQIQKQKHEQRNMIAQVEQRIQRLQKQIKDAKHSAIGMTPQSIIQSLEEESNTNKYMVQEVHPKETASLKKHIQHLQKIVTEPAMGQSDLEQIQHSIRQVNVELNKLVEARMMSGDPMDNKMSLFRQQAAIVARKKKSAAEALQQCREELSHLETELDAKRNRFQKSGGGENMPRGDEFKAYVNKLRGKNVTYKKKKTELSALRSELGILSRTNELLARSNEDLDSKMSAHESKKGVSGYRNTQDALENVSTMKSEYDQVKGRTLDDISDMVLQLNKKIERKKAVLGPIIAELRPLRQHAQDLTQEHSDKKMMYDTTHAGLESSRSKLEQEVHALQEEIALEESRYHMLTITSSILEHNLQRVTEEMKLYTSSDQADKKKSLRDHCTRKIVEQENLGKTLREKQKSLRDNQETNAAQTRMWRDVEKLLEMKRRLASGYKGDNGGESKRLSQPRAELDEERLILQ